MCKSEDIIKFLDLYHSPPSDDFLTKKQLAVWQCLQSVSDATPLEISQKTKYQRRNKISLKRKNK